MNVILFLILDVKEYYLSFYLIQSLMNLVLKRVSINGDGVETFDERADVLTSRAIGCDHSFEIYKSYT